MPSFYKCDRNEREGKASRKMKIYGEELNMLISMK
jgi:hypothetical protein